MDSAQSFVIFEKIIPASRHILAKVGDTKFHGNPFSAKRADTSGKPDGRTDMTKQIEVFHERVNGWNFLILIRIYSEL